MQLEITTDNERRLPEMVALVLRLNQALLDNPAFQAKIKEVEACSRYGVILHWSINNRGWNESHRQAGVHSIRVTPCRLERVLHPISVDGEAEHRPVCLVPVNHRAIVAECRVTARETGLELTSIGSRGAIVSEEVVREDLISFLTWDHSKGDWHSAHPR